jgi:hypothetical protein
MQKASTQIYVHMAKDQSEQTSHKITPNIWSAHHTPQCFNLFIYTSITQLCTCMHHMQFIMYTVYIQQNSLNTKQFKPFMQKNVLQGQVSKCTPNLF